MAHKIMPPTTSHVGSMDHSQRAADASGFLEPQRSLCSTG